MLRWQIAKVLIMNSFWKFSRLLALMLSCQFNVCAATNEVATFSGTVVDTQGNPVVGAAVDCYDYQHPMRMGAFDLEARQHVVTDGQGNFELSTFAGQGVM